MTVNANPKNITQSAEQQKKNKFIAASTGVGAACGGLLASEIINMPLNSTMINLSKKLTPDKTKSVITSFKNAFNNSVLPSLGTEIKEVTKDTVFLNCNPTPKFINLVKNPKLKNFLEEKFTPFGSLKAGKNAYFSCVTNKLLLPKDKLALSYFHEMGHALNHNTSKIGKFLQYAGGKAFTAGLTIALMSLLMDKKKETPEHKLTKKEKFANGFRKSAPWLASLSMLPMLIEEGMASVKGHKIAKQVLTPELAKKVKKNNIAGFCTYATIAIMTGVSIAVGQKIRDKVSEKLAHKQSEKN